METTQSRSRTRGASASDLVPSAGRVPPHDLDAEAAVLSAILLDRNALDHVQEILKPEHFYSLANGRIYEAIQQLVTTGSPIDIVSVKAWLNDRQWLTQVGGLAYLVQLSDATPAVAHIEAHARVVREKWRLRQLIATCQRVAAEGYGDVGTVQGFVDSAEQQIYELARTPESSTVLPIKQVIMTAFKQIQDATNRGDAITGVSTGFERLDAMTAGLHDGDLMIVAARPGMGKTSFVLNMAVNIAMPRRVRAPAPTEAGYGEREIETPGLGVAVFSLEMPREQLGTRMVCAEARVDLGRLRQGHVPGSDWNRLTEAAGMLSKLPIWIDDSPMLSILDLRAKVRRIQADHERTMLGQPGDHRIGLVMVDYLQLMKGRDGVQSREQEISEISRGLKGLAKELRVPVVALSQLNRGVETRAGKDKRPMLSDLRESGAIEQDADCILFIYRDEYYNPETTDRRGVAELIISKQRNGPTGKVFVRFAASCTRFDNLAPQDYPEMGDDD